MQCFYLKQLPAVPLLTPAHPSTTPSLFKHKTCTTENTTTRNLKLSLSLQLCPWVGVRSAGPVSCTVEHSLVGHRGDSTAAKGTGHVRYFLSPACLCQHWAWLWWATLSRHLTPVHSQDSSWETQVAFVHSYPHHLCKGQRPEVTTVPGKSAPDSRGALVGLQSLLAGSCCWNCQQGCHVWGWFPHPAAHTGTAGTQVRLWLTNNNSLQAGDSRPCFSSVWIWQLQGTDAWRFVLSFSNTPNVPSALLTPLLFLLPYDPWLQLISKRRQAQLLQIAVMFKLAPWWIFEVANKKC